MKYDVAVIGGGLAGCAAAIASARMGMKTILIERYGYLGGWSTAALVNPFMSHETSDGKKLIAGIFDEIKEKLAELDGILKNCFDPEIMKFALQELVLESGAELFLHAVFTGADYQNEGISLNLFTKSGSINIDCKRLIDCSGDADAAIALGADYESGDKEGLTQSVTLMFDMAGVDVHKAFDYVKNNPDQFRFPKLDKETDTTPLENDVYSIAGYYDFVKEAKELGDYDVKGDIIFYLSRPRKGEVVFNSIHIGNINPMNAQDITNAEIQSRKQMFQIINFVKKYVPGFENSYLIRSAEHVGVRESRRIVGKYQFTVDDVTKASKFEDAICRLAYWVDLHSGKGHGYTKSEEKSTIHKAPEGDYYEIPFRCLVPDKISNVLIAGRCVSSTHGGHGAIRVMPACVAMGQAAGTAAALSLKNNVCAEAVEAKELIKELRKQGALV